MFYLKELRNYNQKLLLCLPKNRRKHNQHFKLLFFTINFHFVTSNQICSHSKMKFASHKQYLLSLLTSRNTKKIQTDRSIPHVFSLFLKRNDPHKPLNAAAPKILSPVCMSLVKFASMNAFYYYWKTLLFIKVYRFSEVILTVMMMLLLKPVFWKKSAFYALCPQYNDNTKVPKKSCCILCFLNFPKYLL